MSASAILIACQERLTGSSGSTFREVAANTLKGRLWEGMPEQEAARQALLKPIFNVSFEKQEDLPALFELGSSVLHRVSIRVDTVYAFKPVHMVNADARTTLEGAMLDNANAVRAALLASGTMVTTVDGTATGLCSGCMAQQVRSESGGFNPESGTARWSQVFECITVETLATS